MGRTTLLEHAAEDFLNELTRQQPWRKARAEELIEDLDTFLGGAAPLSALTEDRTAAWQAGLPPEQQAEARALLADLHTYLRDWNWQA
ncbi:hypothetical protein G6R31_14350 (plasmid) [Deinococcus wulumuqiensis R12]|nr:hypothetical protein G6R31_14350 [Deinococcus wulumuqiensis R12]